MIKMQDGKERLEIGCLPSLWRLVLVLVIIFNFGKILDFISGLMGVCK